jgi:glycine dehydrogenase
MTLMRRTSKSESNVFAVDADTHPQTLSVLATRAEPIGIELALIDVDSQELPDCFGALLSYPGSSGKVRNIEANISAAHSRDILVGVVTDLFALTLLKSPGELRCRHCCWIIAALWCANGIRWPTCRLHGSAQWT